MREMMGMLEMRELREDERYDTCVPRAREGTDDVADAVADDMADDVAEREARERG